MAVRKVCVFTGSRADYSHLIPLLRRLKSSDDIEMQLLVSGGHLVGDQGLTVSDIEADGFDITERVDIVLAADTPTAMAKSFGLACIGYADALARLHPDVLIVPGDRYEAFAAVTVGVHSGVVVAHIGGGQQSSGSFDNQMRHAMSKLAHVHFPISEADRERLLEMGEDDSRIVPAGTIGVDSAVMDQLLDSDALARELGISLTSPCFVVTYHPATADIKGTRRGLDGLLDALDAFPDATVVITAPNVDSGAKAIADRLRDYVSHRDGAHFVASLGQRLYLSLLRHADLVIGNSSSGIDEAPMLGKQSVNIGSRQDGRTKPSSVVDVDESASNIRAAIAKCLADSASGGAARIRTNDCHVDRIMELVRSADLASLRRK